MTNPNDTADVHRLLDEAFAGIEMTPERQDLKEEVRANLVARTTELLAEGLSGDAAARRAVENSATSTRSSTAQSPPPGTRRTRSSASVRARPSCSEP